MVLGELCLFLTLFCPVGGLAFVPLQVPIIPGIRTRALEIGFFRLAFFKFLLFAPVIPRRQVSLGFGSLGSHRLGTPRGHFLP